MSSLQAENTGWKWILKTGVKESTCSAPSAVHAVLTLDVFPIREHCISRTQDRILHVKFKQI